MCPGNIGNFKNIAAFLAVMYVYYWLYQSVIQWWLVKYIQNLGQFNTLVCVATLSRE